MLSNLIKNESSWAELAKIYTPFLKTWTIIAFREVPVEVFCWIMTFQHGSLQHFLLLHKSIFCLLASKLIFLTLK